jgi:ABC-2 type transport system permease protein
MKPEGDGAPATTRLVDLSLLRIFVARDLRSRFRGSYLGWSWALARPLVMLLIYGLIIGIFLGAAKSIPEFMIFIFVGLICWNLFASIVTAAITTVIQSGSLISRNRFPRILLPLASTGSALVDTLIQGAVLVVGYIIVGDAPSASSLLFLIPSLFGVVCFGLAVGLILSAVNVYIRDVGYLTDIALQVGFWLCPILYSYGFIVRAAESYGWSVEWVTRIYMLNPMANGVLGFQRALWPPASTLEGATFSFPGELEFRLLILVAFSSIFLALAIAIFNRLARNFAQEL